MCELGWIMGWLPRYIWLNINEGLEEKGRGHFWMSLTSELVDQVQQVALLMWVGLIQSGGDLGKTKRLVLP